MLEVMEYNGNQRGSSRSQIHVQTSLRERAWGHLHGHAPQDRSSLRCVSSFFDKNALAAIFGSGESSSWIARLDHGNRLTVSRGWQCSRRAFDKLGLHRAGALGWQFADVDFGISFKTTGMIAIARLWHPRGF